MSDLILVKSDVKPVPAKVRRMKASDALREKLKLAVVAFLQTGARLQHLEQIYGVMQYAALQTLRNLQPASERDGAPFLLPKGAHARLVAALECMDEQLSEVLHLYRKDHSCLSQRLELDRPGSLDDDETDGGAA
jgi:hypothetical protein